MLTQTNHEELKKDCINVVQMQHFGIKPQVALVSHSTMALLKMKGKNERYLTLFRQADSDLIIDGEMRYNIALSESLRNEVMPDSPPYCKFINYAKYGNSSY